LFLRTSDASDAAEPSGQHATLKQDFGVYGGRQVPFWRPLPYA
jgi:hypothetical protein